jgi:N4-gp56 family major capsid protein
MGAITSQNLAAAVVDAVAASFLPALRNQMVMGNLVNRSFEAQLGSEGDTVNIPIPPVLSANNISETGTVQPQAATPGNAQVNLNTHIETTFKIPDVVKAIANPAYLGIYMEPAVIALAEKIENDLFSLYVHFGSSVGSTSAAVTEAVVDSAEKQLFTNKLPVGTAKVLVVHEDVYSTLRQIDRFSEVNKLGSGEAIINGTVGRLKDFYVLRSQLANKLSGPEYHSMAFGRDAIALAMRRLPGVTPGTGAVVRYAEMATFGLRVVMSYDANTLAQQFTVDALYGAAVIRHQFGIDVKSNG